MLNKFCVIIGTKKGGTSSLYEYIRQHPNVVGGFKKEPNFFGHIKRWEKGLKWYQDQFVGYNELKHSYGIDATTDYTQDGFIDVAKRMKESGFNFKFIYLVRNPFDKIESQTHQFLIDGDSIRPIYECLDSRIINSVKYYKQLEQYMNYFSKDQMFVINFERLKSDLPDLMNEITRFLELPDYKYDLSHIHNLKDSAVGQSYKGYRLLRELLRGIKLTPYIPQKHKDRFREILGKYGGKKISKDSYKLSERQRDYVFNEIKDDLEKLNTEFGINFNIDK